ncbi:MAG: hypothetical protein R2851_07310 [Caldilineaceae bacterium]
MVEISTRLGDAGDAQAFAHQFVLDRADVVHQFGLGVADADLVVEALLDDDVIYLSMAELTTQPSSCM